MAVPLKLLSSIVFEFLISEKDLCVYIEIFMHRKIMQEPRGLSHLLMSLVRNTYWFSSFNLNWQSISFTINFENVNISHLFTDRWSDVFSPLDVFQTAPRLNSRWSGHKKRQDPSTPDLSHPPITRPQALICLSQSDTSCHYTGGMYFQLKKKKKKRIQQN